MEMYVVRVYRQTGAEGEDLVGVVEHVGVEGEAAFRNVAELGELLRAKPETGRNGPRRRRKVRVRPCTGLS